MNRIIIKKIKTIKPYINGFEGVVLIILSIIILKGIFFQLPPREPSTETMLIQNDSIYLSKVDRNARIITLINSIHQHQGFIIQDSIASESLKMQGRLLFITLFSSLITILYYIKNKEHRKIIAILATCVGLLWYGINVHELIIENRGLQVNDIFNNTEIQLINDLPNDNRLYSLDYAKFDSVRLKEAEGHIYKKINRFITPDYPDIVFNLVPLVLFIFIYQRRQNSDDTG